MIERLELLLLIRSAEQIDAVENLIVSGLSTFAIDADFIVGLTTTPAGDTALRAVTLPASKE